MKRVLSSFTLFLCFLSHRFFAEGTALLGIDLGNEFIKVSILTPGKGFNILINNQSKRKIANAISFANKFRSYDEEAKMFSTKHPHLTLLNSNSFLAYNIYDNLKKKENFSLENFDENDEFYVNQENYDFEEEISAKYYAYNYIIDKKRGTINIKLKNDIELSSEDITANILSYIKKLAYNHLNIDYKTKSKVNLHIGCVIAVPCNFNQRKKQALYHATKIAGLELLGIIHGVTAAAIHNVLDLPLNTSKLTMYLDVGSRNVNVGIATISNVEKDKRPSRSIKMYACETLENASGNKIDIVLAEYLRKKFEEKHNLSIVDDKKAMRKLLSASNKAKLLLSAKNFADVYIEGLHENKSLVENVTREDFENMISEVLEKLKIPVHNALKKSSFELKDIEALELIGSAWRVPKVLKEISTFFEPLTVGMHLNSDEAITMGSLYIAAYNSANFRIKDLTYMDIAASDFQISINTGEEPLTDEEDNQKGENGNNGTNENSESNEQKGTADEPLKEKNEEVKEERNHLKELIGYKSKYPINKSVVLKYKDNLKFALYENEKIIAKYSLSNLDEATKKKFENMNPPKVHLKFRLDRYGILNLEKVLVHIDEEREIVEPKKEQKEEKKKEEEKKEEEKKEEQKTEEEKQKAEEDEKKEEKKEENQEQQETKEQNAEQNEKNEQEKEQAEDKEKENKEETKETEKADEKKEDLKNEKSEAKGEDPVVKRTEIVKHRFPLTHELTYMRPLPLTNEEIKQKTQFLNNLDTHDINIFLKQEAKNTLESFIYESRSKLKQELFKKVSEETVRNDYLAKLEEYEEWLYIENDEPLENVHTKLKELKDVYEPIRERAQELELRPETIEKTNKLIKEMNEKIINIANNKPWALETVKLVTNSLEKEVTWWKEVQEEQKKLNDFAPPAFKATEVEARFRAVSAMIETLNKLKKPVEKKPSKDKEKEKKGEEKEEEKKEEKEEKEEKEQNKEEENMKSKEQEENKENIEENAETKEEKEKTEEKTEEETDKKEEEKQEIQEDKEDKEENKEEEPNTNETNYSKEEKNEIADVNVNDSNKDTDVQEEL